MWGALLNSLGGAGTVPVGVVALLLLEQHKHVGVGNLGILSVSLLSKPLRCPWTSSERKGIGWFLITPCFASNFSFLFKTVSHQSSSCIVDRVLPSRCREFQELTMQCCVHFALPCFVFLSTTALDSRKGRFVRPVNLLVLVAFVVRIGVRIYSGEPAPGMNILSPCLSLAA